MTDLPADQLKLERRASAPDNYSFVQGEFEITIVSDGYITVPIDIVAPEGSPEERNDILTRTGNLGAGLVESKTNIPLIRKGGDLIIEACAPGLGQPGPVGAGRGATLRKFRQRVGDLVQAQSDVAGSPDEGQASQHLPFEPALTAARPSGRDEALTLVEPDCRCRESAAPGYLADGEQFPLIHVAYPD